MKPFFKILLKYYLKYITKLVLVIHRPMIIVVAGSTNKTFVRDEIRRVFIEKGMAVRANPKNFNTEIGLPLAILGIGSGYGSYRDWLPAMKNAFSAIFKKNFPEVLVLELGVSQKGDMKYLLSIVKPEISIITNITQRYIESFSGLDRMMAEYEYLVKNTQASGRVILNYDNESVRALGKKAKAKVVYFGKTVLAEDGVRIESILRTETGEIVEMNYKGKKEKISTARFGEHYAYSAAVGVIVKEGL